MASEERAQTLQPTGYDTSGRENEMKLFGSKNRKNKKVNENVMKAIEKCVNVVRKNEQENKKRCNKRELMLGKINEYNRIKKIIVTMSPNELIDLADKTESEFRKKKIGDS